MLIGNATSQRAYVDYEIRRSVERGNGVLGIYIDGCKDRLGNTCPRGVNPLTQSTYQSQGQARSLSILFPTYDWVAQNGYANFSSWIETAARIAGK